MTVIRTRIVKALIMGARSVEDLQRLAFAGQRCVLRHVKQLHEAERIHICRWMRGSTGPFRPVYRWGKGKDVDRPAPLSTGEICKAYRQRQREAFGENYGLIREVQKRRIPGRQVVVAGQVVYQQ